MGKGQGQGRGLGKNNGVLVMTCSAAGRVRFSGQLDRPQEKTYEWETVR